MWERGICTARAYGYVEVLERRSDGRDKVLAGGCTANETVLTINPVILNLVAVGSLAVIGTLLTVGSLAVIEALYISEGMPLT